MELAMMPTITGLVFLLPRLLLHNILVAALVGLVHPAKYEEGVLMMNRLVPLQLTVSLISPLSFQTLHLRFFFRVISSRVLSSSCASDVVAFSSALIFFNIPISDSSDDVAIIFLCLSPDMSLRRLMLMVMMMISSLRR